MKRKLQSSILMLLAATQAVPAHAMWARISQALFRSSMPATRLTANSVNRPVIRQQNFSTTRPNLLARTLAAQQLNASQNNNSQSHDNDNARNEQQSWWQRWRTALFKSSIGMTVAAACGYISADEKNCFAAELPAPEIPEASRVCYSQGDEDSEKCSDANISEFEKFVRQFAPPEEIRRTIEANKKEILRKRFGFFAGSSIDGSRDIFVKGNDICRIINAERMRKCIKQNNLHALAVPKKYIYKLDDQWIVVAKYVKGNHEQRKFTLEEVQQLAILAAETVYSDWHANNIIIDKNTGKITLIDTEDRSFGGYLSRINPDKAILSLKLFAKSKKLMDKPTETWLENHSTEIDNRIYNDYQSIQHSRRFDSIDLDFEKVKEEWRAQKMYSSHIPYSFVIVKDFCFTDSLSDNTKRFIAAGTCAVILGSITWWLYR